MVKRLILVAVVLASFGCGPSDPSAERPGVIKPDMSTKAPMQGAAERGK